MELKEKPPVSVIITTRNSAATIMECLKSITAQDYPEEKIEIILVDNNSSDKTVPIAKNFTDKIFIYGPERSAQRNLGVQKAQGKYILYLDSDMSLSKGVISECVEKCEGEGFAALYIPEKILGKGFWIRVRDFERSFYNATCIDCVRFARRDKFLEIGGFDENLTGPEDWDFDRRIKESGKTGIIEASLYHNEGIFDFKRYLQKKGYYSKNLDSYIDKWGRKDKILSRQLGFWYRYFIIFIEQDKWKPLLRHPLWATGMYWLRLAVGLQYLKSKWKIERKVS